MQSVRQRLFLFAIAIVVLACIVITPPATARAIKPNRLEITRTPGLHSHVSHEMVTKAKLIQDLYTDMLSLPAAPSDQICPFYIIANYQLTFYYNKTVVKKVNALKGRCQPVTLSDNDIRTADSKFWALMNKVVDAGTAVPASKQTSGDVPSGTATGGSPNIGSPTPTPPTPTPTIGPSPTPVPGGN